MRMLLAGATLLASVATAARAQSWRTVEVSRQLLDTTAYKVYVEYGAGRLELAPSSEPVLYQMHLRYDDDHNRPLHAFDADAHALRLGLDDGAGITIRTSMRGDSEAEMRLGLTRAVPLDLFFELGAVKAHVDVGGLSVRTLHLATGASHTELDFSEPNPVPLKSLDVELGAAGLVVRKLGNANTGLVRVKGGVGSIDLDFGGEWTQDVNVEADVALGKVRLRVPRDVGVRVEVSRFLASFDHEGLEQRGDAYYSDNWERATFHLRVRTQTTLGGIVIERSAR